MDKEFTKKIAASAGLTVADGVVLRQGQHDVSPGDRDRLGLPVFVKPAREGSSIGVSKVEDWAELPAALDRARKSDDKVLVEAAVPGREIDIGVLERPSGDLEVSPPMEILPSTEHTFFDYRAKYADSATVFDVPARLDPMTSHAIGQDALRLFRELGCSASAGRLLPPARRHQGHQRGQHLPRLHQRLPVSPDVAGRRPRLQRPPRRPGRHRPHHHRSPPRGGGAGCADAAATPGPVRRRPRTIPPTAPHRSTSFQYGVLPGDLVALELPQVATAHLDPHPLDGRPGQQPLRAAPVAADPVPVVAVVDVGDAGEAGCQPGTHLLRPRNLCPHGCGPRGISRTGSSAKKPITASRSWALKASATPCSVSTVALPVPAT